jgi:hypothetical protein
VLLKIGSTWACINDIAVLATCLTGVPDDKTHGCLLQALQVSGSNQPRK